MKTVSQLRMYSIKEGKMAEWLDGWTRGVLPSRRKFGFRVDGAWVVPTRTGSFGSSRTTGPMASRRGTPRTTTPRNENR
ncbi:MAG: hypothetical protein E6J93_04925 [Methanobacteriota archaeon]|nr:MAG: hypothetical protein E6J93_04925 [Euryarchaeota archaeon]